MNSFFHGLFPSGWRLSSPLRLYLPLHLHGGKSPLKDLIEAQRSSLHRSSTSKLPSSGIRAQELQFLLPFVFKPPTRKNHNLETNMSLHSSSSVNGEGSTPKDPLYKILNELRSLKLWKEKQERKEKGKKVEEINQDERKKIREEERRKILKELRKEKHASYNSHNSCKRLSEELCDYYEGRHRAHLRPHSHWREKERKPQETNINLPYFHGKDNVEVNLDWEIKVEQQLKRKSTSKSYGSHSYPKKYQGQGILGVTPSKPKDDKGKTIEKQSLKASMQEKTSSIKCFKCLRRGHITSQCPTKKTMIMRGQDIYSSQDEATTSHSSSESEEAKGEESSEEIYPQEEGQPLMVKEECKEISVSSKRLAKKESHFEIKTNIKETSPLRQPPHLLLCKKTLVSTATPLRLEVIPQVKKLLDEGLVRKSLNPCALLVPKIGIIRHQIPKISDMMNVLSVATLFCKISHAPNIFMIHVHWYSLGRFVLIFGLNTNLGAHMGHLSDQGVPTDPKRIKVVPDWPTPPSIREIWGCHDLTKFYKRFVPYFSTLVAPLIELVRNHVPSWEDTHERGFQTLPYRCRGKEPKVEGMMQSYLPRVLDKRIQEDWARATKEGPRVLMNLRSEGKKKTNTRVLYWFDNNPCLHPVPKQPAVLEISFQPCKILYKQRSTRDVPSLVLFEQPITTTQVDVLSTCTTKDVPSNVLRQSSQAVSPLKLCEGGNNRILRRLVLRSFGKGRRETQKEFRRFGKPENFRKLFAKEEEEKEEEVQRDSKDN
ncbi:putative mitochondrial protein [Glycine soja]